MGEMLVPMKIQEQATAGHDALARRRWLVVAQAAWLAFAALALLILLAGIPLGYARLFSGAGFHVVVDAPPWYIKSMSVAQGVVSLAAALVSLALAGIVFWKKREDPVALLVSFYLLAYGTILAGPLEALNGFPPLFPGASAASGMLIPTGIVLALQATLFIPALLLFYLFPTGHFVPAWTRYATWLLLLIAPLFVYVTINEWLPRTTPLAWCTFGAFVMLLGIGVYSQVYRYRHVASPIERQKTKWVVFGVVLTFILMGVSQIPYAMVSEIPMGESHPWWVPLSGLIWWITISILPFSLAIAVLGYRLWDIDLVINRALVYGSLTAFVVGMYILSVGAFGAIFQAGESFAPLAFATILVILIVRPLHTLMQSMANRLIPSALPSARMIAPTSTIEFHGAPRGRWRLLADGAWVVALTLALITVLLALPGYVRLFAVSDVQPVDAPAPYVMVMRLVILLASIGVVVLCLALATVLFWRKRTETMALVTSFFLLTYGIAWGGALESALGAWQSEQVRTIASSVSSALTLIPILLLFFLFPSGHFVPRWTRGVLIASLLLVPLLLVVPVSALNSSPLVSSLEMTLLLFGVVGLAAQVYRYRRISTAVERQQTKGFVYGLFLAIGLGFLASLGYPIILNALPGALLPWWSPLAQLAWVAAVAVLPLALTLAVMRYRLWDIDLIVNRTLVYGALSALVVVIFVFIVTLLGALFQVVGGINNLLTSLLATAAIAVLFQPLRERLQRAVNRLTYGERDEPYAVLTRLGQRLESTLAPEAVLPTIVETVGQALKVPYAAIDISSAAEGRRTEWGQLPPPSSALYTFLLLYQNEALGTLIVAPRTGEEKFSAADLRLLNDLARQAGVAAHSVKLTTDLQRLTAELQHSRERLVTAREEERRRLRRDLHDGLGPTLAALALNASTVRDLIGTDSDAAMQMARELQIEIRAAVTEIRRLVYALRPPTLDELGLVAAIHELTNQSMGSLRRSNPENQLCITVDAPDTLPPLPAAVEVAAYRIAQEALTNVVRHARARSCAIRLALVGTEGSQLQVEIRDDGIGLPEERRAGVGLNSMRERAEELGGTFVIESQKGKATRVVAHLPIARAEQLRISDP